MCLTHFPAIRYVPYSRKFWWGKTLANLAICYEFAEVFFIYQLLVISEKLGAVFAKCNLACYLPKFSPTKIFCYVYVVSLQTHMQLRLVTESGW